MTKGQKIILLLQSGQRDAKAIAQSAGCSVSNVYSYMSGIFPMNNRHKGKHGGIVAVRHRTDGKYDQPIAQVVVPVSALRGAELMGAKKLQYTAEKGRIVLTALIEKE